MTILRTTKIPKRRNAAGEEVEGYQEALATARELSHPSNCPRKLTWSIPRRLGGPRHQLARQRLPLRSPVIHSQHPPRNGDEALGLARPHLHHHPLHALELQALPHRQVSRGTSALPVTPLTESLRPFPFLAGKRIRRLSPRASSRIFKTCSPAAHIVRQLLSPPSRSVSLTPDRCTRRLNSTLMHLYLSMHLDTPRRPFEQCSSSNPSLSVRREGASRVSYLRAHPV